MLTPVIVWDVGSHWCAVGEDEAGELLKPIGRGATRDGAIDDLRHRCGEPVTHRGQAGGSDSSSANEAAKPEPPAPAAAESEQLGLGVG